MPTFSGNAITNARYVPRRDVNGRLWFMRLDAGERYFYMDYSDDEGASFTADGTIFDNGSNMGSNNSRMFQGWCNDGETPIVAVLDRVSPYPLRVFLRTGVATWTQWGTTYTFHSTPNASTRVAMFQGPDNVYHLLYFTYSGTTCTLKHYTSTGVGSAFVATYDNQWTNIPGSSQGPHENGASDFLMDRSGNIYAFASGCYPPNSGTNHGLSVKMWSVVSKSWHPQNAIWNPGGGIRNWCLDLQACFDRDGYIHVMGHPNGPVQNFYQPRYWNNRANAWSAGELIQAEVGYNATGVLATAGTHAEMCVEYIGYGVNTTKSNVQHYSNETGSFVRTAVLDEADSNTAWRWQGDSKNLHIMPVPAAGMGFAVNNYPVGSRTWFVTDDYAAGTWKAEGIPHRKSTLPVVKLAPP